MFHQRLAGLALINFHYNEAVQLDHVVDLFSRKHVTNMLLDNTP